MSGVIIGKSSFIRARSVVMNYSPPYSITYGLPVKVMRQLSDAEIEEVKKNFKLFLKIVSLFKE